MADPAHVYTDEYDQAQVLALNNLPTADVLIGAIRQGDFQRRLTTANDVPSAGGFNGWARTTRALRDDTDGAWEPVNSPIPAVRRDGTMIIVVAGNSRTGLAGVDPVTKNKRGIAWREMLGVSSSTIPLFGGYGAWPVLDHNVWVTMLFPTLNGVRAEISKPVGVDDVLQRIVEWSERILFGEIRSDDGKTIKRPGEGPEAPAGSDVEFAPILRKPA